MDFPSEAWTRYDTEELLRKQQEISETLREILIRLDNREESE